MNLSPRSDLKPQGPWSAVDLPPEMAEKLVKLPPAGQAGMSRGMAEDIAQARRMLGVTSTAQKPGKRRPREGSFVGRIERLLSLSPGPMTSHEIAAVFSVTAGHVASVLPYLVRHGRVRKRLIQQYKETDLSTPRHRIAQYLAAGREWPPVPDGHRLYIQGQT